MSAQTAAPCKRHPDFQTSVSCGRCGDRVCPRCLVHAPVGVRCPDCGRAAPNPIFDVPTPMFLRATAVGLGIALLGSAAIALIVLFTTPAEQSITGMEPIITLQELPIIGFAPPAIIVALGYFVGEGVSRAVNRKRGTRLKILVCSCMFIAFTIATVLIGPYNFMINLIAGLVGFYLAISKF